MRDHRITEAGVIIIKSQAYRSRRQNQQAALTRLSELLSRSLRKQKKRVATKPSAAAKRKRRDAKSQARKTEAVAPQAAWRVDYAANARQQSLAAGHRRC